MLFGPAVTSVCSATSAIVLSSLWLFSGSLDEAHLKRRGAENRPGKTSLPGLLSLTADMAQNKMVHARESQVFTFFLLLVALRLRETQSGRITSGSRGLKVTLSSFSVGGSGWGGGHANHGETRLPCWEDKLRDELVLARCVCWFLSSHF